MLLFDTCIIRTTIEVRKYANANATKQRRLNNRTCHRMIYPPGLNNCIRFRTRALESVVARQIREPPAGSSLLPRTIHNLPKARNHLAVANGR